MASVLSNKIKQMLLNGSVDFGADSFIIILMQTGFVFNIDTHEKYADVIASELATAGGYTQGTKAVTISGSVVEDDAANKGIVTFNNVAWTASATLVASGAIIYDDTIAAPAGEIDAVMGYIDFGGDQTVLNTGVFTIANITLEIA